MDYQRFSNKAGGFATVLLLAVLMIFFFFPTAIGDSDQDNSEQKLEVREIVIKGNQAIPDSELLETLGFTEGESVTKTKIEEGLSKIEEMGTLSQISTDLQEEEGKADILIELEEYPVISDIEFTGNDLVGSNALRKQLNEVGIEKGEVIDKEKLDEGLQKVLEKYEEQGYPLISIDDVDIQETLTVEIIEGQLVRIRTEGLKTVSEEVALEMIDIPEGKPVKMNDLARSYQELNRSIYFTEVELVPGTGYSKSDIILTWKFEERVLLDESVEANQIKLVGNEVFSSERIQELFDSPSTEQITNYHLLKALKRIYDLYQERGYSEIQFKVQDSSEDTLTVELDEGRIQDIEISGNSKTLTEIIENQLVLEKGMIYNELDIRDNKRRLSNLGYFTNVQFKSERTEEGIDLTVDVKEKDKLGSLGGALTWSGSGLVGNLDVAKQNLLGWGQDLSLNLTRGFARSDKLNGELGWKNVLYPPEYDHTDVSLFRKTDNRGGNKYERQGIDLSLSYPFGKNLNLSLGYSGEYVSEEGSDRRDLSNILSTGLSYDTRDDPNFPTFGSKRQIELEKAGNFAPGSEFTKANASWLQFTSLDEFPLPPLQENKQILGARAKLEVGLNTPSAYRSTLGGPRSLRGIDSKATSQYALFNGEYRLELVRDQFYLSSFVDAGSTLNGFSADNFDVSTGIEINARLFGHIRVGLAWPISEKLKPVPEIYFMMGPMF